MTQSPYRTESADPTGSGNPYIRRRSRRTIITGASLGVVALGGVATTILLSGCGSHADTGTDTGAAAQTQATGRASIETPPRTPPPTTPAAPTPTPTHTTAPTHTPSPAIETLQRELGQLNYYEGPVTGFMNASTAQAVTYLQRDAHLQQTGVMNAATQAALQQFLSHGDSQMGG